MEARDAQHTEGSGGFESGDRADWLAGGSDLFLIALTIEPANQGLREESRSWPADEMQSANCRYAVAAVKRVCAN